MSWCVFFSALWCPQSGRGILYFYFHFVIIERHLLILYFHLLIIERRVLYSCFHFFIIFIYQLLLWWQYDCSMNITLNIISGTTIQVIHKSNVNQKCFCDVMFDLWFSFSGSYFVYPKQSRMILSSLKDLSRSKTMQEMKKVVSPAKTDTLNCSYRESKERLMPTLTPQSSTSL